MKKNFLVSTALREEFNPNEKNFFLGKWCVLNQTNGFKKLNEPNTLRYHWTNKTKLKKDYLYLKSISEKILDLLVLDLNEIHNINENKNYWRIVINPWIISYLSVLFDRWEILRIFLSKNHNKKFYSYSLSIDELDLVPNNHVDFWWKQQTDEWNHIIFKKIITFLKPRKIILVKKKFASNIKNIAGPNNLKKNSFLKMVDSIISPIAFKFNKVIFESFYFPKRQYLKLCLKNFLIPTMYTNLFDIKEDDQIIDTDLREKLFKKLLKHKINKDKFLNFVIHNLSNDLPKTYIENFTKIKNKAKKLAKKKKIILSMHSIVFNDYFKTYVAESKKNKSIFVYCDHGGGMTQELDNLFDYFDKVSNKRNCFDYTIKRKNHLNLSPTLPIINCKKIDQNDKKYCTIVYLEGERYSYYFTSQKIDDGLAEMNELLEFIKKLPTNIKKKIKFRTKNSNELNLEKVFSKRFGNHFIDKPSPKNPYHKILSYSKLIITNYPKTAFSESLYYNVPTILICKRKLWQFTKSSNEIFDSLRKNKIAFESFDDARNHITKNWDDLDFWWNSKKVQMVRKNYLNNFFNIKKNWYDEWKNFVGSQKDLLNKRNQAVH